MTENELASFVGSVKPIGLTILFVLANLVRPPRIAELSRIISMNAKTLAPELDRLALLGYVQALPAGRHPRWVLTDKAQQLPLFAVADLTGMLITNTTPTEQPVQADAPEWLLPAPPDDRRKTPLTSQCDRRNSPLTDVVDDDDPDLDLDRHQHHHQQAVTGEILRSERRAEVLQACVETGIGYPANRDLAGDEWVTADRVRRAVRQCQLEGRWTNPQYQAISRLEEHLEPKTTAEIDSFEARFSVAGNRLQAPVQEASPGISMDMPRMPAPDPDREAQQTWQAALGELQLQMTKLNFQIYVKPALLVAHEPDFVLAVETPFLQDWLATKMLTSVKRALASITNRPVTVRIITWEQAR